MNAPWSAEARLEAKKWASVRHRLIFECCKWDIQSEDQCVVADFPLLLDGDHWKFVARQSEILSAEVLSAESELIRRADLLPTLALPRGIRALLAGCTTEDTSSGAARIMRFDFHFTVEGWRISEVNADVPGGFIEASGFTEVMSEYYPGCLLPPNPAKKYLNEIEAACGSGALVGLVHATAHYDDRQVMQYLSRGLERKGMRGIPISPAHLKWQSGFAEITSLARPARAALLVRFFPAEWLANLPRNAVWEAWFRGGKTLMSNPGSAIVTQSKRFPLTWPHLKSSLTAWRTLLPETRCASDVATGHDEWVYKPALGRVGEDVAIVGVTEKDAYEEIVKAVRRRPEHWIAQKRFHVLPLETPVGPRYVCLGVFTLNAKVVGVYGRISSKPLTDDQAQDIAVFISSKEEHS